MNDPMSNDDEREATIQLFVELGLDREVIEPLLDEFRASVLREAAEAMDLAERLNVIAPDSDFDFLTQEDGFDEPKYFLFKNGLTDREGVYRLHDPGSGKDLLVTTVDPNATYFVLRLDTDASARVAADAYANHVYRFNPALAEHVRGLLRKTIERFHAATEVLEAAGIVSVAHKNLLEGDDDGSREADDEADT